MTDLGRFSVVGLDLSLTAAGVATIQQDGELQYGLHTIGRKGSKTETLRDRLERIVAQTNQIRAIIDNLDVEPRLATIESPAQSQTTGSTHDRSGLWWDVVRALELDLGIPVVEVGIGTLKIYAAGKGTASKDEVLVSTVRRYHDVPISNNNEADAFTLAAMAARLIARPIEMSLPKVHVRAMEGLHLP